MDELIAVLVAGGTTGLAILAYRFPAGFSHLAHSLYFSICVILAVVLGYHVGAVSMQAALDEFIASGRASQAASAASAAKPETGWIVFFSLAAFVYVMFLHFLLPQLIRYSDRDNVGRRSE